jgi:hypothetical protein
MPHFGPFKIRFGDLDGQQRPTVAELPGQGFRNRQFRLRGQILHPTGIHHIERIPHHPLFLEGTGIQGGFRHLHRRMQPSIVLDRLDQPQMPQHPAQRAPVQHRRWHRRVAQSLADRLLEASVAPARSPPPERRPARLESPACP